MKNEIPLGKLIEGEAARDAIHIAVCPVVSKEFLSPGQDVGIREDGTAGASASTHVGIVDPFLKARVCPGDKFFILLYPNTITSLRHEWVHPAFDKLPTQEQVAAVTEVKPDSKLLSFMHEQGLTEGEVIEYCRDRIEGDYQSCSC